jgi:ribosomal-protein-alanine N-acetyltransferase
LKIAIRKAREADYPAVAQIQGACHEAAQWPLGDYSQYQVLLALADGQPVGFCVWRQITETEAELLNLGVIPAARREGVGKALLQALEKNARGDIFLEVAEPNVAARGLYQGAGWTEEGTRKGYYEGGTINAVVMKKRSWYSPG